MTEMPMHVQRSSFHPTISFSGEHSFRIEMQADKFNVMVAYPTRAIKHTCHPHTLLQLGKSIIHNLSCDACGKDCDDSCFSCKKCDFNIHPRCIPLPTSFTHKRHMYPLVLVSPVVEDDTGNYYCDMCETQRNPKLQVYYCGKYNAHIDCVISEVLESTVKAFFDPQRKDENSGDQRLKMEGRVQH
ncbi:hypothetical protein V6N12_023922 [Hibiscus sabdariffa]|uniref:DC1 domain-containing protein n=1 Tax=Hibiscus sabdariffa TaxID=183260 RepID=A0ABR2FZZ2_9ROSI